MPARKPAAKKFKPWVETRNKEHYTKLRPFKKGEVFEVEWATYLENIAEWLAQGLEGQYVLIKGNEVLGFWEDEEHAMNERRKRFFRQPALVHQILEWEPILMIGYNKVCRS